MRQTLATLATLACARAWPALDEALAAYPGKHAAAVAKLEKGQGAKVVLVGAHHGLGNREHALLSSFGLALATDAALFVDWGAGQKCAGPRRQLRRKRSVCTAGSLDASYASPGFAWTRLAMAGGRPRVKGTPGDAGSSPLDRARTAASSPRNDWAPDALVDFHTVLHGLELPL